MFYERFAQLCAEKGLAPSTAATKAGFNRGTVSIWKKKFEAGQDVYPDQDTITKICIFFGCSEQWLRGLEPEKAPAPKSEGEIGFDDFTYAMFEESKDLPPEKKQMLLEMARFMRADMERNK